MESIENKIYRRIKGKGHLWCFSESDFWDIGSRAGVRISLMRLVQKNKIRRIMHGLYDYPKYSEILNQFLSPDLNQAAQALARKFGWRIQPSGDTALNLLGLSTQVPGKIVYLSDGPYKKYSISNQGLNNEKIKKFPNAYKAKKKSIKSNTSELIFQKTLLKHSTLKLPESALIVQALEILTHARFNENTAKKIRSQFDEALLKKILLDTRSVKGWIYDCIRVICLGEKNE